MLHFKINNFLSHNGNADYKGLDIDKFVCLSQQYDFENGFCVLSTIQGEDIPIHADLTVLNEKDYLALYEEVASRAQKGLSHDEEVDLLRKDNENLKMMIADLGLSLGGGL